MNNFFKPILIVAVLFISAFAILKKHQPTFYIIGDSTVKNGGGNGNNGQWGWGSFMYLHLDTHKIQIKNHAIGGRSSRTFITEGRWNKILETLQKGDYVIMQFGHNDGGPLDDTARARGTIKGIGDDSTEIYNPIRKVKEVVHTYGWYMRKYVRDAKAKGAIPIVCSLVPRQGWKDGKISRSNESYALWAQQVAEQEGALFIPLTNLVADEYEKLGADVVKTFFHGDNTHQSMDGAKLNAQKVTEGLKNVKPKKLKKYFL
jgi:rhamnogalacturonan acetylesterase